MNVLLVNYEMDPASRVLAWQLAVARRLAQHCRRLVVLTNYAAAFPRPDNMDVELFPRRLFRAPWRLVGGRWWVNALVWRLCRRRAIDACLIHMNMEWGYRLAPTFRALGIPVLLWYAHGAVTTRLRLAHRCVTRVITSTPEGFRLPSDKLRVIGQGVDTELFGLVEPAPDAADVITVGRLSARKRVDRVLEAFAELRSSAPDLPVRLVVAGAPITADDRRYEDGVRARASALRLADRVRFAGHVPMESVPALYRTAFAHVNLSRTGSLDKTILESLAVGCPVLTSNDAARDLLAGHPDLWLDDDQPRRVAERLRALYDGRGARNRPALRALVVPRHDLASYTSRIHRELEDLVHARKA